MPLLPGHTAPLLLPSQVCGHALYSFPAATAARALSLLLLLPPQVCGHALHLRGKHWCGKGQSCCCWRCCWWLGPVPCVCACIHLQLVAWGSQGGRRCVATVLSRTCMLAVLCGISRMCLPMPVSKGSGLLVLIQDHWHWMGRANKWLGQKLAVNQAPLALSLGVTCRNDYKHNYLCNYLCGASCRCAPLCQVSMQQQ
jgi:hypothetical protein